MMERCPVCHSNRVRIETTSLETRPPSPFPTRTQYWAQCASCGTQEIHTDDEPGFAAWLTRWRTPR
jgi:hypothetical protein